MATQLQLCTATMGGLRRLLFPALLALAFTANQAAFGVPDHDRDHERHNHRHITGTAMNDVGFLAALASGVGTYLLVRRRASHK